jgi:hypothetical protein
MTSKLRTVAMFVIVNIWTVFHMKFIGLRIFLIYLCTFHIPISNIPLVISLEGKAKYGFHAGVMLFLVFKTS